MKRYFLSLLFVVASCLGALADDFEFKAVAPNQVAVGQQFRLEFHIKNTHPQDFKAPEFKDFEVLMGPSMSTAKQISIINGTMTSIENVSYTYVLLANQEGTFTISPARFTHNGKTVMSNALTIKVSPQSASANTQSSNRTSNNGSSAANATVSNNEVLCIAEYSKKSVYEQEPLMVTIKLYHKGNVSNFEEAKLPEFSGFVSQEINVKDEDRNTGIEVVNGERYYGYVMKKAYLFPQRTGKIEIEPGKVSVILRVQSRTSGRGGFFDDFFTTTTNVKKDVTIKGTSIDVKPLPTQGKPADFAGAVGNYKLETTINTTDVKANEAINYKIKISGTGNIKYLKTPEIKFPNDFEVYDPKIDTKINTTANGISGSKEVEYLVIPRYAGTYEIPTQTFSYFDPKEKKYVTLNTKAFTINVEKGENSGENNNQVVSNYSTKENVKYLGKDIRFINTKNTTVKSIEKPFFGTTAFWLWFIIPLCVFATLFVLYRKQLKENSNIILVKNKRANKQARKRLKKAEQHLQANEKEPFYEEVLKALWGYTSDKLNIPVSELNKDNIESKLSEHNVEQTVVSEFMDILQTCEFARFAPVGGHEAMDSLYGKAVELISTLEEQIKK